MIRQEIKEIAKIIHKVEFPNSFCWNNCDKCFYKSNCDYLKAGEALFNEGWRKQIKAPKVPFTCDRGDTPYIAYKCGHCGAEIYEEDKFCSECGVALYFLEE